MDSITQFAKENFQFILLFLSVLGMIIAFISVVKEVQYKKRRKQKKTESDSDA